MSEDNLEEISREEDIVMKSTSLATLFGSCDYVREFPPWYACGSYFISEDKRMIVDSNFWFDKRTEFPDVSVAVTLVRESSSPEIVFRKGYLGVDVYSTGEWEKELDKLYKEKVLPLFKENSDD